MTILGYEAAPQASIYGERINVKRFETIYEASKMVLVVEVTVEDRLLAISTGGIELYQVLC
jgi:hypothetical protein